jgi:hypothetical protein
MSPVPTAAPAEMLPPEPSLAAAILSYLIPGLGQIYQGRYGKGLLFMGSLLGMFFLGQAMGQWQNVYVPRGDELPGQRGRSNFLTGLVLRWHYPGQFWIGVAAWPALWQHFRTPDPEEEAHPSFWNNFQKVPDETALNKFLINEDKTPDLGWVYTVIAGMLNILVIYDAYAGAAFSPLVRPPARDPKAPTSEARKEGAI